MTAAEQIRREWSLEAPVTEEVKNMCIEVAKKAGVHFDVCIPKTFRVQILSGAITTRNYLVKVKVGVDDKCLHAMINQGIFIDEVTEGSEPTEIVLRDRLTGVRYPKHLRDPLIPFEVEH